MRRAVFLDRDGVLSRAYPGTDGKSHPPASPQELEILPGVVEACQALRRAGFVLIVVSNQPDVARGRQTVQGVEAINDALRRLVPLDDVRVCYHDGAGGCGCRKPKPGLLLDAGRDWEINLSRSYMVGDRWTDVQAGWGAGCEAILIADESCGLPTERRAEVGADPPVLVATSLSEAVAWILGEPTEGILPKEEEKMKRLSKLGVKIFADGADKLGMLEMYSNPLIKGFTTNPTLMQRAGIDDYRTFAREIVAAIPDRPVSFEVLSDEFEEMELQAFEISSWGENVYVKVPVTNTCRQSSNHLLCTLARAGVKVNATALMTLDQVRTVSECLADGPSAYVSVFAGRIADTGRDPVPIMAAAVELLRPYPNLELIWASPRELLNIFQADAVGCHIITATNDILKKLALVGKDLHDYSLDTVKMFHDDACRAGIILDGYNGSRFFAGLAVSALGEA